MIRFAAAALVFGLALAVLGMPAGKAQTRLYTSGLWAVDQIQTPDGRMCVLGVGLGNINGPSSFAFAGSERGDAAFIFADSDNRLLRSPLVTLQVDNNKPWSVTMRWHGTVGGSLILDTSLKEAVSFVNQMAFGNTLSLTTDKFTKAFALRGGREAVNQGLKPCMTAIFGR